MLQTGYLYLVPLFLGAIYLVLTLVLGQTMKNERPFESDRSNLLYNLGGVAPFKWFVEEDPHHEKILNMNHLISEAGMEKKLDYRSGTTLQIVLFLLGSVISGIAVLALPVLIKLFAFLLNLDATSILQNESSMLMSKLILIGIGFAPALLFKVYLKRKAKSNEIEFLKDLPLLQLFIILMLRSNRTISDVLYVLSTTKSTYQKTFQQAYLVFLREPSEGFNYLEDVFDGTKLIETIYTLRDFGEYAKEENISSLENNQEEIVDYTADAKKKAEAGKNLWATVSMSFPFVAVILLGGAPLVSYGIGLLSQGLG